MVVDFIEYPRQIRPILDCFGSIAFLLILKMGRMMKENNSFEQNLQQLELIVKSLEKGQLGLESSIASFESGIDLYRKCRAFLDQSEKKIKVLTDDLKEEDYKL
jgi:exodeoxyribonuclease VII small subunit